MADDTLAKLAQGAPSMGSGMAEQAKKILASRGYRLHVQEAMATGEKPMSPEEFAKQRS